MIAVMRIAVPDADSQLKRKTAGSAVSLATTGGTRATSLSSPPIGIDGAEILLRRAFTCGVPQANTVTVRMIQGMIARRVEIGAGAPGTAVGSTGRERDDSLR